MAIQAGCHRGRDTRVALSIVGLRDSGNHLQAKTTLVRQSAAAINPGSAWPKLAAEEPMSGPTMTPADVAAESHPSARARSAGATVSATYACATPVVPPILPRSVA